MSGLSIHDLRQSTISYTSKSKLHEEITQKYHKDTFERATKIMNDRKEKEKIVE
jgi:hypothetical protein